MKPSMLLIACSHRLHESHDTDLWASRLVKYYLEQLPSAVIVTSDLTEADLRVGNIVHKAKRRMVVFTLFNHAICEYDENGTAKPKRTWHGRSIDRAMVTSLLKAKRAGWDVTALVLDHDRSLPDKEGDGDLVEIERMLVKENIGGNCFAFDPKNPTLGIGGA